MIFQPKNILFCIFVSCISLSLSACSFFSPVKTDPDTLYLLDQIPRNCTCYKTRKRTLLVMPPDVHAAYNTTQMAFSLRPHHIAYYGKTRWAATPGQMLLPLMVKAIDDTHYYHAVVPAPFAGSYDYVLNTQLIELTHDYGLRCPKARIIVRAQLLNAATGRIIKTKEFIEASRIKRVEPYSAVFASNRATANFLRRLSRFTARKIR